MAELTDIIGILPQVMQVLVILIVLGVPIGGFLVWQRRIKRDAYAIILKMREGGLILRILPARADVTSGHLKIISTGEFVPIATVPVSFKKEFWERGAKPAWIYYTKEPGVYQPLVLGEPVKNENGEQLTDENGEPVYTKVTINTKSMELTPLVNYAARQAWLTGQKEKERIYANRGLLEKYGTLVATIIIVIMIAVLAWKLGDVATAMQSIKIPSTVSMVVGNASQLSPPPI